MVYFTFMRNLIVILGPTASGKSALGVRLAKKLHGVVISADSRQVYKGLNIGTGKITAKEMRGVPHFLLNVASPKSQYSVARYVPDAARVLKRLPSTAPVFLVGGSPFYIDALTKPDAYSPVRPNPTLRRRLAAETTAQLVAQLRKINPARLKNIDFANRRRLIRAIEIASYRDHVRAPEFPSLRVLKIGLNVPRVELYRRINRRVDSRMRQGMAAEVRRLHESGLSWKRLDDFGLEYRWLSRYLRGRLTKAEAVRQLKSVSHDFAKRQMTWWKRDRDIHWIDRPKQAERLVRSFLATD